MAAVASASAEDVLDLLDGGLSPRSKSAAGRSGGQRQRLVLTRALTLNPDVLVLVEPTSAVDAHTEATIASRLRRHRTGRTTVVTTASPLLLDRADEVALMENGRIRGRGTSPRPARGPAQGRRLARGEV